MPTKKWTLTMEDWPSLLPGRRYKVHVVQVEPAKNPPATRVTVEHVGKGQNGRRQVFDLTLPLRPGTLAVEFLEACGLHLDQASPVAPQDAAGAHIYICFDQRTQGGEMQPIAFQPAEKEQADHGKRNQ